MKNIQKVVKNINIFKKAIIFANLHENYIISMFLHFPCKFMKYFQKLIWEKIYLSPLNPDDAETLTKWWCDERISKNTNMISQVPTLAWEKKWLEEEHSTYTFAIVKKEWDELLWTIELWWINFINQTAELGIAIWNFEELNKWYGTDAVKTIIEFGFNTLNLYNISLRVKSFNENWITCYKKCGFKEAWTKHHSQYYNWERYDLIFMEVLKPDRETLNK